MSKISDNRLRGIRTAIPSQTLIGRIDKGTGKAQLLDGNAIRKILGPGFIKSMAGSLALTDNHIFVGNASNLAADVAMSGDATIVASGALTLANSGVTANTYGDSTHVGQFTVDAKGRLTAAGNVAISGSGGGSVDPSPFSDGGITKPAAADFTIADDTTVGHGTGSKANLATRGVELTHTLGANATSQSLFFQSAVSSTLDTMIAYISPNFVGSNGNHAYFYGIGVRDNTGKVHAFGLVFDSGVGNCVWFDARFTNISTAPTLASLIGSGHVACGRPIWIRLKKVTTNFEFSVSLNGETYTVVATVSATVFVGSTLNDVGVVLYNAIPTGTKTLNLDVFSFTKS